jgi:hypothetical protein
MPLAEGVQGTIAYKAYAFGVIAANTEDVAPGSYGGQTLRRVSSTPNLFKILTPVRKSGPTGKSPMSATARDTSRATLPGNCRPPRVGGTVNPPRTPPSRPPGSGPATWRAAGPSGCGGWPPQSPCSDRPIRSSNQPPDGQKRSDSCRSNGPDSPAGNCGTARSRRRSAQRYPARRRFRPSLDAARSSFGPSPGAGSEPHPTRRHPPTWRRTGPSRGRSRNPRLRECRPAGRRSARRFPRWCRHAEGWP